MTKHLLSLYREVFKTIKGMPTIFTLFGIRFYFYKHDHEPIHVHVEYQGTSAKIQVEPEIQVIWNHGLKSQILKKALETVATYKDDIIAEWYKNFPKRD